MTSGRTVLLVEDGSGTTALAAARSLCADGWRVVLATAGSRSPAAASKSCQDHRVLPALTTASRQAWLDGVRAAAQAMRADVVLPCGDAELLVLSAARDQLGDVVLPYPDHACVLALLDKLSLARAARESGIPTPDVELAQPSVPPTMSGPYVVKPRLHGPAVGSDRLEAHVLATPADAEQRAAAVRAGGGEPLYQEHIEGQLTAYVVVRGRSGAVLRELHQVATRTYPLPAGSCVRGQITAVPPGLTEAVDRLLATVGWWGLVQLELIRDAHGELHLVDANPRPYGTLALAEAAGAGLCSSWLQDALGHPAAGRGAPQLMRFQSLGLDLRRALGAAPGRRLQDLTETLRFAVAAPVRPVWSRTDPAPFGRLVRQLGRRVVRRWAGARQE